MKSRPHRVSAALLFLLFLLSLYRAKTQSLTIDEARTFHMYVNQPLSEMCLTYDACNHVLHTLITKFFRYFLGYSELVLRLGSLTGCLLYFAAVFRMSGLLFNGRWMHTCAVAALTMNPLVLDLMVAARGYGLALALFWWALYYVLRTVLDGYDERFLWRAGTLCGLAVGANLTLVVPVAVLGGILALFALRRGFWPNLDQFIGPAVVIALLFNVLPLARAQGSNFYVGSQDWTSAIVTFFDQSFDVRPDRPLVAVLGEGLWNWARDYGVFLCFIPLAFAGLFALIRTVWTNRGTRLVPAGVAGAVLLGCVAVLTVLKLLFGVLYPYSRTGLYLIPVFTLAFVVAMDAVRVRAVTYASYAALVALSAAYLSQLDTRYFSEWQFDASTNRITKQLAADHAKHPASPSVRVGATWLLHDSLNFYRKRQHLNWMEEVRREDLERKTFDYYVLVGEDQGLIRKLGLTILFTDELSGAIVARRT